MLVVFDFDSTLMDGESIDILAKRYKVESAIAYITKEAMEGRLDFFESLLKRVALLENMPLSLVQESIRNDFSLMQGAIECVQELRKREHIVVCFSGGFRIVTEYFKPILGLNATFSNILHSLESMPKTPWRFNSILPLESENIISPPTLPVSLESSECVVIGDGANDLSMFAYADTKIAFCAKDILKKNATHCIENKDLREVLQIIT